MSNTLVGSIILFCILAIIFFILNKISKLFTRTIEPVPNKYEIINGCVVEKRKWHEKKGIEHIDIWLRDSNNKDHKIHFSNGAIDALKGHKMILCRYKSHNIYAKNINTGESAHIMSSKLAHSLQPRRFLHTLILITFSLTFYLANKNTGSGFMAIALISGMFSLPLIILGYLTKYRFITRTLQPIWEQMPTNLEHEYEKYNKR